MLETHFKTPHSCGENDRHNPKFQPFPRLPKELRLRIWKLAASSTVCQVVDIPLISFSVPPLLHTIKEARSESERLYTKLRIKEFSVSVRLDAIWLSNQPDPIFTKFIMDIIANSTPRIEKLAIRLDTWFTFCLNERDWMSWGGNWWNTLQNIRELAIVIGQYSVYLNGKDRSLTVPQVEPRDVFGYFHYQQSYANLGSLGLTNGNDWEVLETMASDFLSKAWQRRLAWVEKNRNLLKDSVFCIEGWKVPDVRYYELKRMNIIT